MGILPVVQDLLDFHFQLPFLHLLQFLQFHHRHLLRLRYLQLEHFQMQSLFTGLNAFSKVKKNTKTKIQETKRVSELDSKITSDSRVFQISTNNKYKPLARDASTTWPVDCSMRYFSVFIGPGTVRS